MEEVLVELGTSCEVARQGWKSIGRDCGRAVIVLATTSAISRLLRHDPPFHLSGRSHGGNASRRAMARELYCG
jgi:hypothetical protein